MEWHILLSQRVLKEGCNVACTLKSSVKISSTQTWWQLAFSKTGPKIYFLESRRTKIAFKFFHFNVNCLKIINILYIGPFHLPCVFFLFEDKKQQLITIFLFYFIFFNYTFDPQSITIIWFDLLFTFSAILVSIKFFFPFVIQWYLSMCVLS